MALRFVLVEVVTNFFCCCFMILISRKYYFLFFSKHLKKIFGLLVWSSDRPFLRLNCNVLEWELYSGYFTMSKAQTLLYIIRFPSLCLNYDFYQ